MENQNQNPSLHSEPNVRGLKGYEPSFWSFSGNSFSSARSIISAKLSSFGFAFVALDSAAVPLISRAINESASISDSAEKAREKLQIRRNARNLIDSTEMNSPILHRRISVMVVARRRERVIVKDRFCFRLLLLSFRWLENEKENRSREI